MPDLTYKDVWYNDATIREAVNNLWFVIREQGNNPQEAYDMACNLLYNGPYSNDVDDA